MSLDIPHMTLSICESDIAGNTTISLLQANLKVYRLMDISMKAFNNARERDPEIWASLFSKADPRFQFLGVTLPAGARMAIIVAEWQGESE